MFKFYVISTVLLSFGSIIDPSYSFTAVEDVFLVGHRAWFHKIISDLFLQLEFEGWNKLTSPDTNTTFSHSVFGVEVAGRVNYTNGFLKSIAKVVSQESMQSINQVDKTVAVAGGIDLQGVRFGFNVDIELNNVTTLSSTVVTDISRMGFYIVITKHTDTNNLDISISRSLFNIQPGHKGEFRPANDLTEIVGINFNNLIVPSVSFESIKWSDVWSEKLRKIISNDAPFPKICYNCLPSVQ